MGIDLGADYCAEHEWGIKGIRKAFGLNDDPKVFGIDRRRVRTIPGTISYIGKPEQTLIFHEKGTRKNPEAILIYLEYGAERHIFHYDDPKHHNELRPPKPYKGAKDADGDYYTFSTAWSEGSFGIHVKGLGNVNQLKEVYQALLSKDIAIWLGGGGIFQNAGLVLGIISRLPADKVEMLRAGDEDRFNLERASSEIGIHQFLKEKGKAWFALSPNWTKSVRSTKDGEIQTQYPVMYWLNPMEQKQNNSGYFTVEQLKEWADNKGPIPTKR